MRMKTLVWLVCVAWALLFMVAALAHAQKKSSAMDQVKAYAADHEKAVTVTKRGGYYWVEVDGLDPHGVGKTIDEAAEDFLHCADMMDHEPIDAAHSGPPKAPNCDEQSCI